MPTINKPTKQYKQIPYKHDRQSEQYYNNKAWKHLRDWFITTHPICEECNKQGIVTPATDVHHIIPFLTGKTEQERWQLFLDDNNLMSLCSKCHHNIHKQK